MAVAKNFVEKTLGKDMDPKKDQEISVSKIQENIPVYTPPPSRQESLSSQPPTIQIIEKIVYKKQRIHGFFRTLMIIALLVIGFLMLGESTGLIELSVNSFKLHQIFPIFIIFSTIIIRSYKGIFGKIFGLILFLAVFGGIFTIGVYTSLNPSTKRKSGNDISYSLINTGKNTGTNLYIETLIGNSYIQGSGGKKTIEGKRNSDRHLLVVSGETANAYDFKLIEDNNRNVLQNYVSNIDLMLPNNKRFDLLYIKNLFGLHTIDLTTFKRKVLKFHAGIDDITIKVGNVLSGNRIEIQGTAANVRLDIPKNIGVLMYYKHLVGMLDTPQFDVLSGHYFQSQNMSGAKAILDIYVNLGAGNTKINWIEVKNN